MWDTIGEWNENNTLYLGLGAKSKYAHHCLRLTRPGGSVGAEIKTGGVHVAKLKGAALKNY